ncbi:hypothetical protein DM02DRAFT_105902 [Periconia macrospinosa]|uniref:Uncharacterized protein n=1 Tax=Periconia macrospinosa TaxID=97972 RepID=A0A2V1DEZ7_9PLEO|nr:hypothetical protein DM02DRAFT_105902 [Periconia macrospinosa]
MQLIQDIRQCNNRRTGTNVRYCTVHNLVQQRLHTVAASNHHQHNHDTSIQHLTQSINQALPQRASPHSLFCPSLRHPSRCTQTHLAIPRWAVRLHNQLAKPQTGKVLEKGRQGGARVGKKGTAARSKLAGLAYAGTWLGWSCHGTRACTGQYSRLTPSLPPTE